MNPSSSNARLRPFRPVPFGRYTLLSQLATGGMGEIFLARLEGSQGFEKLCVIKKILPQLAADPEFVERFVGEARTLVKLSHGSIAQVLDMGLHEGDAYMALEYVDGKDLRKVAARARDRQKPLPLTFILFVMGRVLDALAYAHRKKGDDEGELNLVHRDISPQNILISYEGEVKVIDFGLAKSRLSAAKTDPSIILGKFLYMSPEQARHQPVDRRGDLYAVGLCLYELVSGRNPFDLLPPGELMSTVAHPAVQPLEEVVPSAPPAVTRLVMKALAVDPAQRFQTAEELRGKLNACLLELDPSSGPERVSESMHELFGPEYQGERRLLASLREAARPPGPEPVELGMPEGVASRPLPVLPPKTIRLDGPIEPLSFRPTPRTREGGLVREEGETRPAVPTSVMDEPTRPAVDKEAIEESRRERPSPPGGSPTVDISGLAAPLASRSPAPGAPRAPIAAVPRVEQVLPEVLGPVPIEDTPIWSEPLRSEEDSSAIEPPRESQPGTSGPEEPGEESVDVGLADTNPRIQVPRPAHDDTQPRVVLEDVYRQDTQPRVVLDESLARDSEEEVSQGGKTRRPRRRVTSSTPRMALTSTRNGEEREAANDPPGEAEPPVAREITRRTSVPTRPLPWKGLTVALALLLVGGGVGAAAFLLPPEPEPVEPPPARPILPVKKAAQTPPPAPAPADGAPSAAAPEAAPAGDPGPMDASSPDSLLAPLTASSSATASAPGKRPVSRKRTSSRNPSVLQREWARTRAAYKALTRVYACENLDLLCSRYENLEAEVEEEGLGEAESAELLGKVRAMQREIQRRKKGS